MARTAPRMRPQIAPRDAPNTAGGRLGVREVPLVGLTCHRFFLEISAGGGADGCAAWDSQVRAALDAQAGMDTTSLRKRA